MELSAALYGFLCAGALGLSDFVARATSRAIGPLPVAAAMLAVGCLVFAATALALGLPVPRDAGHLALAVASGVVSALGMILFYSALTLGQISYVVPLAATYPVWAVLYAAVFLGLALTPLHALASLATLAGGWIVAAYGELGETPRRRLSGSGRRLPVVACALGAGLCLVVSVYLVGPAAAASSELGTLAVARGVAAASLALLLLARRRPLPRGTLRWLPLVGLQGLLDGLGIFALYAATAVPEGALGVVVSSTFGVVTVLLGWSLLKERVNRRQWLGILLAMGGAVSLGALG